MCRACYLLFTDTSANLRYRAVPDRFLSLPDFGLGRREWEALQIPVGVAFFFRNSALERTVAFYPGPAGATESELDIATWAAVSRDPRVGLLADDVEALLVRLPMTPTSRHAFWCRSTRVTSSSADFACCGADSTAERRPATSSTDSSPASPSAKRRAAAMTTAQPDVTFSVLDVIPERYAVSPTLLAHLAVAYPGDEPIHAIALRCQVRIQPLRRGCSDAEAVGLLELFGPGNGGRAPNRAFRGSMPSRWCRVHRQNRATLSLPCTTTWKWPPPKYFHALRAGPSRCSSSSAGRSSAAASKPAGTAGLLELRGPLRHAGAVWRDLIALHYPNSGWLRLSHASIAALRDRSSPRNGLLDLDA